MNNMFKMLILICFLLVLTIDLKSQTVVSAAGSTYRNSNFQISWTLGENAIQTYQTSLNTLTMGFHQPALLVTRVPDNTIPESVVSVYPNPAFDKVIVKITTDSQDLQINAKAKLFDDLGRLFSVQDIVDNESIIPLGQFPAGNYTLIVTLNNKEDHQFKIIKILK